MTERFNFIAITPVGVFCFIINFINFSSAKVQFLRGLLLDFSDEGSRAPALVDVFDVFAFGVVTLAPSAAAPLIILTAGLCTWIVCGALKADRVILAGNGVGAALSATGCKVRDMRSTT